ncbi:hypothetical protein ALNOE001_06630 [Candidatus Methanobinarius endosymbioticus]|uniref:SCP domain-containing protein n=1 Tax=Candidatus Methanobinarius endosymbioticus TaxID=2006182 RepID=A0A366MEB2_9EURY|nr:hypothetical protein ALNOE001_06630 [Candidatus Methanobinarius endosymbioticus]
MALSGVIMPTIHAENINQIDKNQFNTDQYLNSLINRILELVNLERAKFNLNPLTLDEDLNSAAKIRSQEIQHLFDHKRPDGSEITTISSKIQGENIASAQPTAEQVMRDWMDSPSHRQNILTPEYTTLGVGYTMIENDLDIKYGTHYWVQLFGGIKESEPIKITMYQIGGLVVSSLNSNKTTLKWNSQNTFNANGFQIFKYNPSKKLYLLKK